MDPRPRQTPPGPPGSDLDSTDELPALDSGAIEATAREALDPSGTWMMPRLPLRAAPPAQPSAAGPPTAADDPLQTAVDNLREARALLARRDDQLKRVEQSLEGARTEVTASDRRATQLADELKQARAEALEREARLGTDLAAARAEAERRSAQHTGELARSRSEAAEREARLGEELARARAAAGRQVSELAEEAASTQRARDAENARVLGERDRAQAALQAELARLTARATRYFETLQSAERRRALLEGLVAELGEQAEVHEARRADVARELAGHERRGAELEAQLKQRAARIATLEGEASAFAARLSERDRELARLQAAQANLSAMLESARSATTAAGSRAAEHETALTEARGRIGALEAELAAARKSLVEREQELTKTRGEMQEWAGALQAAQVERHSQLASASASDGRVRQLEERVAEQAQTLHALQAVSDAAVARSRELEADLHAAEDSIARLESQLRGRNVRVSELEKANQQWRLTLSGQPEAADAREADEPAGGAGAPGAGRDNALEGATRLLIHADGEREVVHVLGRRTTIGRTPDNDLRIDAKYISRHHAVILSSSGHTIIEDLNSTNGIVVNGKRVTRQLLHDGDSVVIGRTHYRFSLRRTGEKR